MTLAISQRSRDNLAQALGVAVNIDSLDTALEQIVARASAGAGFCFFTLNLDHLVKLQSDRRFQDAYRNADFISADGWPIVWLLRQHGRVLQRTTGADLVDPLCARAAQKALPAYFIGPGRQQLDDAVKILKQRHPDLIVAGAESPMLAYDFSDDTVAQFAARIRASGAKLCFLSLGAPKQEALADALRRKCPEVGFLCVGAALDFISGHTSRAPRLVQKWRMEWLWRMATDPARLAPRYMQCLSLFVAAVWRINV